jgi:hypothetical protein
VGFGGKGPIQAPHEADLETWQAIAGCLTIHLQPLLILQLSEKKEGSLEITHLEMLQNNRWTYERSSSTLIHSSKTNEPKIQLKAENKPLLDFPTVLDHEKTEYVMFHHQ